jgi:hypothetical protein
MANIGKGRQLRVCDLCGGVDDHPRHRLAGTTEGLFPAPSDEAVSKILDAAPAAERGRLLRELHDTSSSDRHLDCCADAGCPTGTCGPQVADAPGTGRKMLDHLAGLSDPFTGRDDVVPAGTDETSTVTEA